MSMNHVGLWAPVVNGKRKDHSAFGRLPRDLRDEVIMGLDSGRLTLAAAADLLKAAGHPISTTAIANSYAKLRAARREMEGRHKHEAS